MAAVMVVESAAERFERLYAGWRGWLVSYVQRRVGDRELAQDLAADVFTNVWRSLANGGNLADVEQAAGLLAVAAKRVIARHRDVASRGREMLAMSSPMGDDGEEQGWLFGEGLVSPEDVAADVVGRVRLGQLLAMLSEDEREVVRLRVIEGVPAFEVRQRLGMTEWAASRLFASAIAKLRAHCGVTSENKASAAQLKEQAREVFLASLRNGTPLTTTELGARFGRSQKWGSNVARGLRPPAQTPRYRQIADAIEADIATGVYEPGQRVTASYKLALRFESTDSLVYFALRHLAERGVLERTEEGFRVPEVVPVLAAA